jgi:glutamyl-tRNA synthetase
LTTPHSGPVRVRFAPSPTGFLHIGGARTALFNWLFARKHSGQFILRIEDTDQKRYVPESEQDIMDSLRWLGLNWDEGPDVDGPVGPYRQSERSDLYREWAEWLVDHGYAYRCDCTAERLEEVRKRQQANKEKPGYDGHCRDRKLGSETPNTVIRFKVPLDGETVVHDEIRGPITFQNVELQDLVLLKSDGLPTYHLANVVDDHLMGISHIMRADEWIATAPLHWRLYEAFGWEMPKIAHLPVILSPGGQGKLSKRDQSFNEGQMTVLVQVREYREAGFLPEAVINWLTNIGWAFGDDREEFTPEEVFPRFELQNINPSGGKLPFDKLEWLNGVYIRKLAPTDLAGRLTPVLEGQGLTVDQSTLLALIPLIQERIKTLNEAADYVGFVFRGAITIDDPKDLIQKGMDAASTRAALKAATDTLSELDDFHAGRLEEVLRTLADELGLKAGQLFGSIRVAVTGQQIAPPLFETLEVLGKETALKRLEQAAVQLAS